MRERVSDGGETTKRITSASYRKSDNNRRTGQKRAAKSPTGRPHGFRGRVRNFSENPLTRVQSNGRSVRRAEYVRGSSRFRRTRTKKKTFPLETVSVVVARQSSHDPSSYPRRYSRKTYDTDGYAVTTRVALNGFEALYRVVSGKIPMRKTKKKKRQGTCSNGEFWSTSANQLGPRGRTPTPNVLNGGPGRTEYSITRV